ncbi:type III-B CRISPR module RAMP protein Cmr4 [Marinitoga sp. 1155]|uniref:type III-B CRISPR module RAMP protein Cmr4 n=1 Tax=Marinitoga sp. 1155 TaxID=1428448 RepID=UPI00064134F7|nr:type III-B CRISPR module RAMP protein Cmr4 [Marinitoga sp. 1155]KLO23478.1 CRISPR-associated protein Cmr4 [Marinitoga sp. 1155]
MFKMAKPFFIRVMTPLHAGSGQDLGIVDLPIQRERHTGFPKIEGSGIKGSIREVFGNLKKDFKVGTQTINNKNLKQAIYLAFGPEEGDLHAGALGFTDARILLFPVKSMKGIFAYITCPKILERFKEEMIIAKNTNTIKNIFDKNLPSKLTISNLGELAISGNIVLEEYTFKVKEENTTKEFAIWLSNLLDIDEIKNKLVVLPDDDFKDFVNLSTEVITRTKIDPKTGTVQKGALFTEEYLPSETIMYSLVLTTPFFNEKKEVFNPIDKKEEELVMEFFENGIPEVIQIGGNATIGKGIVEIKKWRE